MNKLPIKREGAGRYVLIVLITLVLTIIITRLYLELTGWPVIGKGDIHFAHALFGGMALFIGTLLPIVYINPWATKTSALLSGIGMGLFIDEVGKFITQDQDYFSPLAVPIILVFILVMFLIYIYYDRPEEEGPNAAVLQVLEELEGDINGHLAPDKIAWMKSQLKVGRESKRTNVAKLATLIESYLKSRE